MLTVTQKINQAGAVLNALLEKRGFRVTSGNIGSSIVLNTDAPPTELSKIQNMNLERLFGVGCAEARLRDNVVQVVIESYHPLSAADFDLDLVDGIPAGIKNNHILTLAPNRHYTIVSEDGFYRDGLLRTLGAGIALLELGTLICAERDWRSLWTLHNAPKTAAVVTRDVANAQLKYLLAQRVSTFTRSRYIVSQGPLNIEDAQGLIDRKIYIIQGGLKEVADTCIIQHIKSERFCVNGEDFRAAMTPLVSWRELVEARKKIHG